MKWGLLEGLGLIRIRRSMAYLKGWGLLEGVGLVRRSGVYQKPDLDLRKGGFEGECDLLVLMVYIFILIKEI